MNCNDYVDWMHDYIDGELSREDSVRLKEHMLACLDCCSHFDQLEKTEALLSSSMAAPRKPMLPRMPLQH